MIKLFRLILCFFIFLALPVLEAQVTIAVGERTPELNGSIAKFEYSFGGTGFFNLINKTYSVVQSHYYISYDRNNLYIAVVSPVSNSPMSRQSSRDGNLWEDDSVEIHLLTAQKEKYQFIINPKGIVYDAKNGDRSWDSAGLRTATRIKGNQWVLEAAFPFRELTPQLPAAGTSWKLNICRSFKDNMTNTTISPCNISYSDTENFAVLNFITGIPAVDIESIGDLNNNNLAFKMEILGSGKTAGILTMNSPKTVLPYQFEKHFQLYPSKTEVVEAATENLPPDNTLKINLKLKNGILLYHADFAYKNQSRIAISYIYTDIKKQVLRLVCSCNKKLPSGKNNFIIKMFDENSRIVLQGKQPVAPKNVIFTVPFSIAKLPPGEYKLVIQCTGPNNEILLDHWEQYRKSPKRPNWADTQIGISDKVPAPWTSITATGNQFKCWGRTYSFGKTGILPSIKSQGNELLAGPVCIIVNGHAAVTTAVKLVKADRTSANYLLSSSIGKMKINTKIRAEFDGFLWVELAFLPSAGTTKINNMVLEIPLRRDLITGFDNCQSNKTKVDLTYNSGKTIANNFALMPACWIGGDDVGLMIGAENLKGWHIKNKNKSMEIAQDAKTITMRLNLIDTPLYLRKKRSIGFYLEATPAKPKNWNAARLRADLNALMWSSYWNKYYDYYQVKYLDTKQVEKLKNFRKHFKVFHYTSSHGTSPYSPDWNYYGKEWHSSPPALGAYCVDNDVSKRYLRDRNTFTYACLNCKSFFDFKLTSLADFINNPDIGIENLYIDLAWPKMCGNEEHGCAWTDEFGDKQSSFDIIGTRKYYQRLYNILKAKNPDAIIAMHIIRARTPAASFADLLVAGEGYDRDVARQESYYDVLKPKTMRIMYASRGNEQTVWLIPQFTRGFSLFRPQRAKTWKPEQPEANRAVKHFIGYMVVHNISFWRGIDTLKLSKPLYEAQDWLGWDKDVAFLPYWKTKDNPVKLFHPQSDRIMTSVFTRKGKALFAILNDTDKTVQVTLKIDLSRLGLKNRIAGNIPGKGTFSKAPTIYTVKNGFLKLSMGPRDFKLLKFE